MSKVETGDWLTTGEMARLSQTTLRTVRFYEAEGLITSEAREGGTHRKFPPTELEKLRLIADFRAAGLSLPEIKAVIALKAGCPDAQQGATQLSSLLCAQAQLLDQRIATLQQVRAELASIIDMLSTCKKCTSPVFPAGCTGCDKTQQYAKQRTAHLLWRN